MLDAKRSPALDGPVHRRAVERSCSSFAVRTRETREQLQVHLLRETTEGAVADVRRLVKHARFEMLRDQADHLLAHVEAVDGMDVQSFKQRLGRLDASLL